MIHDAATNGSIEMITDLIEKHAVNPKCKGKVSSNTYVATYMFNSNSSLHSYSNTYMYKLTWKRMVCLIYTHNAREPQALVRG